MKTHFERNNTGNSLCGRFGHNMRYKKEPVFDRKDFTCSKCKKVLLANLEFERKAMIKKFPYLAK